MPSALYNSFSNSTGFGGTGSLLSTGTIIDPMVYALEQPISNITEEVKQTLQSGWNTGTHLSTLAAWWLMGYVGYLFVTDVFAPEVENMQRGIRRAFKRARIV